MRFQSAEETRDMMKETVSRLSQLIRDKDVEIDELRKTNDSLLPSARVNGDGEASKVIDKLESEKLDLYERLSQKHQESLSYYNEIQRLLGVRKRLMCDVNNAHESKELTFLQVNKNLQEQMLSCRSTDDPQISAPTTSSATQTQNKESIMSSNPTDDLEFLSREVPFAANVVAPTVKARRSRCFSETLSEVPLTQPLDTKEFERLSLSLKLKEQELADVRVELQEKEESLTRSLEESRAMKRKLDSLVRRRKPASVESFYEPD